MGIWNLGGGVFWELVTKAFFLSNLEKLLDGFS